MNTIGEIIGEIFLFVVIMFALLIVLLIVISKLPNDNPLKRILNAFSVRVGVTLGAGVVAIPTEFIPGIDLIYDIGVPAFLAYFWYTFFRDVVAMARIGAPQDLTSRQSTPQKPRRIP